MEPKKGKEIFGSGINFLPQWAKIIIGLSILALLFFWIGIEKTLEALSGFKMIYLALAFVIFGAILFLNITGIFLLTSCVKKTGFKEMGIAYLSSWAIGFMLPGKFGDYAFAPLMQKHGFKTGEGIAVITLDKMITFAIILSGAIFGTLFFVADQLIILLLAVFILATCTLLLFTEKGRSLLKKQSQKT